MEFVDPNVEEMYQRYNRERHLFRMEMYTVCVLSTRSWSFQCETHKDYSAPQIMYFLGYCMTLMPLLIGAGDKWESFGIVAGGLILSMVACMMVVAGGFSLSMRRCELSRVGNAKTPISWIQILTAILFHLKTRRSRGAPPSLKLHYHGRSDLRACRLFCKDASFISFFFEQYNGVCGDHSRFRRSYFCT